MTISYAEHFYNTATLLPVRMGSPQLKNFMVILFRIPTSTLSLFLTRVAAFITESRSASKPHVDPVREVL